MGNLAGLPDLDRDKPEVMRQDEPGAESVRSVL